MSDNDSPLGAFLGLVTLGTAFFIGRKTGQNKVHRQYEDRDRDREIIELKKQIALLKTEVKN